MNTKYTTTATGDRPVIGGATKGAGARLMSRAGAVVRDRPPSRGMANNKSKKRRIYYGHRDAHYLSTKYDN